MVTNLLHLFQFCDLDEAKVEEKKRWFNWHVTYGWNFTVRLFLRYSALNCLIKSLMTVIRYWGSIITIISSIDTAYSMTSFTNNDKLNQNTLYKEKSYQSIIRSKN